MITALAIAIPLIACVLVALGVYLGWSAAARSLTHLREQRDHWRQIARDAETFLSIVSGGTKS